MGRAQPHGDPSRQGSETSFLSAKNCYRQTQPGATDCLLLQTEILFLISDNNSAQSAILEKIFLFAFPFLFRHRDYLT